MRIREGTVDDLAAIDEIHAHYATTTAVSFDVAPYSPDERRAWFEGFARTGPHRLFVAEEDDGTIVGYAHSRPWRPKPAYASSVETTVMVRPGFERRGIGRALYEALFAALDAAGVHRAYAVVVLPNVASLALHGRFGFRAMGVLTEVGWKQDRWWDTTILERPGPSTEPIGVDGADGFRGSGQDVPQDAESEQGQ